MVRRRGGPLALQSVIGNRAMRALLHRQGLRTEVIKSLGPDGSSGEWSPTRKGPVPPLYAEIATLAKANRLRDVPGTTEKDVNLARRALKDKSKDVKPGLNLVEQLGGDAVGETGFVDAGGVYRGPRLPVSLAGPLPRVAVSLSQKAFDRGKDGALGTMRHEMRHAEHFQTMIDWLAKWRADVAKAGPLPTLTAEATGARFERWVAAQKSMSKIDRVLLAEERAGTTSNTELLAYVEGFVNIFHLGSELPSIKHGFGLPPAIYQLYRAGGHFAVAHDDVKAAALARLREYYEQVLADKEREAFRRWLWFLIDHGTEEMKLPGASADDVRAAKRLHNDLKPLLGFLRQVLAIARQFEYVAHKPAQLGDAQPVKVRKAGDAAAKSVKVGRGQVEIRKNVAYQATLTGKTPKGETISFPQPEKKEGVSLTYTGPDMKETRWLQFIWRAVIAYYPDGTKDPQHYTFNGRPTGTYELTDDPKSPNPSFSTDSATKESPYYEKETSANRSAVALTLFDQPDARDDLVQKPFADKAKPPKHVTSYAHLVDYLVRGNEVLFRADIEMSWKFTDPKVIPPVQTLVTFAGTVDRIDPGPRMKLLEQFPEVTYLP
jgi:hypothetical protein